MVNKVYLSLVVLICIAVFFIGYIVGIFHAVSVPIMEKLEFVNIGISNKSLNDDSLNYNNNIISNLKAGEYTCLSYYKSEIDSKNQFTGMKKDCDLRGYCKNIFLKWDDNFTKINN